MSAILFLAVVAASLFALLRYRHAPTIYWLTAVLFAATFIWNQYAANSCESGCDIRLDLLVILPILLIAALLCLIAFIKRFR
ncbi:MAG: hypothetical protein ACRCU5_01480 [Rhizobiaceae bacterium]